MGKTVPTTNETSPPSTKAPKGPIVRAEGLSKSFRMGESEVHVLRNVDLTIRDGEFVAIDHALAMLQPGDLCLVLVDQVPEALAHLAQRQAQQPVAQTA